MSERRWVVVCGHICLDVIPTFGGAEVGLADLLIPGKLVDVGPAVIATGGAVSNTGLALHRLGVPTRLMGKVGDDLFGHAILEVVRRHDPALASGMIVSPEASSSYTIVVNPPGVDRIFLHCPGANDTFGADDVPYDALSDVRLFHFGYPPLMRRMYLDSGRELESLFRRVKATGAITSLDMARPDPASPAGKAPWPEILARVLPHVDLFVPSLDETLYMLDRPRFQALESGTFALEGALLSDLAARLLDLGAGAVALKLGTEGLYLRTGRAAALGGTWARRELLVPCFRVAIVGTTGSGDCAVAGLIAGLLHGLSPGETMTSAAAVGACSVEAADATSGVRTWEEVQRRIAAGWARREATLSLPGWQCDGHVWHGPHDGRE